MIRTAFTFSAALSLVFLAGCNEIPVLSCGTEVDARRFQNELEAQTDPRKLWDAIRDTSRHCSVQTPAQRKLVQDAIHRWAKIAPVAEQRATYAALPDEATELRIALLKATDMLGMLAEMEAKLTESSPETAGNAGRKMTLSSEDVAILTARHKWLSDVLAASEIDGYRVFVTRSTKSYTSNPDRLLVESSDGHGYKIPLDTERYDPNDRTALAQVVRVGKEGHATLMVRQRVPDSGGRAERLTFYRLANGNVLPRIGSRAGGNQIVALNAAAAGSGAGANRLTFLKDENGNLLYAVGIEQDAPGSSGKTCSVSRRFFGFQDNGFAEILELTERKEVDCSALASGKPIAAFSTADDYKKLSPWRTGMQLGQLVRLDRQDASDELLLQTLRAKAPSTLLALIHAAKPPAKHVGQDLADVSQSLKAVAQSMEQLRWIFRGSPYLQPLNLGLREPEAMLPGLAPAANGIDLDKEDLARLEAFFGQYVELRAEVVRELPPGGGSAGAFKHAYEVIDLGRNAPDNHALVLSDEPMGPGAYNVLVKALGKAEAKKARAGEMPRYAAVPKQEVAVWSKYQKLQPQMREYSAKVDGFYQAVLNRYEQLPQSLKTGVFPAFTGVVQAEPAAPAETGNETASGKDEAVIPEAVSGTAADAPGTKNL